MATKTIFTKKQDMINADITDTKYAKEIKNTQNTKYRKIHKYAGCGLAAILTAFSIYGTSHNLASGVYAAEAMETDVDGTGTEEDQSVELSLNYTKRKIIYGSCTYITDMEAFDASGMTIDPGEIEWTSDDESVASVKYGTIFINGTGNTTITATYDGNTATCSIEVVKPKVTIIKSELKDRMVGDKCTNWYTYNEDVKITVKSGNKKVVKVNNDGSLKVRALGKSQITVKAKGGNTVKYTMNIKKRHLYANDDETLELEKYIKHIKNYKNATWTISDPSYLQFLPDGTIKPLKCGKVNLDTKLNGKKYKISLRITNYNSMKELAISALKDTLRYPASLSINSITHDGRSITIDYSSMNRYGGYDRDKFIMKINMAGEYNCETISIYH